MCCDGCCAMVGFRLCFCCDNAFLYSCDQNKCINKTLHDCQVLSDVMLTLLGRFCIFEATWAIRTVSSNKERAFAQCWHSTLWTVDNI